MSTTIGLPLSRVKGPAKVTGRATYAAEFHPAGLAYAAIVESTISAGRIVAMDTAAAEKAKGVVLVLTHQNAPHLACGPFEQRPAVEPVSGDQLKVLQDAEIRFSGQPIGVVVAGTQAQAEYAVSLVRVTYREDQAPLTQFDPARSVPTSAAAEKRGRGPETHQGNADDALLAAATKVDQQYSQPREHHNAMEPHATVAEWVDGRLTLWDKTQWVGNVREEMARIFVIPPESVRVINPFVGGAFGSALRAWPHVTLAAMAAKQAGCPVRLELTRRQLYKSVGFRPHTQQRVALGADHDGQLAAIIQEAVGQTSTYEEFAEATLDPAAVTYASDNRRTSYRLVPMHTNTPCPMRGPGHATGLLAQEIAMDELAAELQMDPVELRLRNFAERSPKKDLPWSSNRLRECYRTGAEQFGWSRRTAAPRSMRNGRNLVGYGMATAINTAPRYPAQASAALLADGSVVVRSATSDMGPGTYTSMTQIAADTLGLPVQQIHFELGDSALPKAEEHGGSTTTASIGPAVKAACDALRAKIDSLVQTHPARSPSAMKYAGLLQRAGLSELSADADSKPGEEKEKFAMYSFGAVFAEVHVDPDFGTIRVPRIVGAYDAGRIVNPTLARSQCVGGMVGGLCMALLENTEWDPRFGRVANANLAEYLVPVCADVVDLNVNFVPGEDTVLSPLGVKGLAELGLCGVAPAIANAVWHATGKRIRDLPITPDKLLMHTSRS